MVEKKLVRFIKATIHDAEFLFHLRNESEARAQSIHSDEVGWEEHCQWLKGTIQNSDRLLFIAQGVHENEKYGQVRFDVSQETAVISIAIAPEFRGRGLGREIIIRGIQEFSRQHPGVNTIIAYIKPSNAASKKAFQACGFEYVETNEIHPEVMIEKWILCID
ncbi:MAG TPA: GNAT family N-acetyltransferase [Candidatus Sumerlaeota bacterium]|nr:GNAT family N-acetyltransferase [Candidatus Sumerlaeota bacterium]